MPYRPVLEVLPYWAEAPVTLATTSANAKNVFIKSPSPSPMIGVGPTARPLSVLIEACNFSRGGYAAAAMGVSQRPAEQKAFIADMAAREADRKQALAIIEAWNARLAARQPELTSPTLRAALISGCHWLHVICPACDTVAEIDLRVVRRDPAMTISQVLPSLACRRCQPRPPTPKPLGLSVTFQVQLPGHEQSEP